MAKQQTEKSRFRSRYSAEEKFVRADQYIAEFVCEKIARQKKSDLPNQFWNLPQWKVVFLRQVQLANSLLKIYDANHVISALRDPRTRTLRSLSAGFILDPVIEEYKRKDEIRVVHDPVDIVKVDVNEKPRQRPPTQKKTLHSMIEAIDGSG